MILITGATGFVGKALVQRLLTDDESRRLVVAVRRGGQRWPEQVLPIVTGDLHPSTNWSIALEGVAVVVHSAARVHVMHDTEADPLAAFRAVNVEGTLNLARQAAAQGSSGLCSSARSRSMVRAHSSGELSLKSIYLTRKLPTAKASTKPNRVCANSAPTLAWRWSSFGRR